MFTPEDIAAGAPQSELATARNGQRTDRERWCVRKDGSRFWGRALVAMRDAAGMLIGFTKFVADTSNWDRAREARAASEERVRRITESLPDHAIISIAADGVIATWSSGAHAVFGHVAREIVDQPFERLLTQEDTASGAASILLRDAMARGAVTEERWLSRRDGSRSQRARSLVV